MNDILQIFVPVLILAISIIGIVVLGPYVLALKKWGFTFLPEGQILTVMNGATRSKHIARIKGWQVKDGRIIKASSDQRHEGGIRDFYHDIFGVYFYGIPPFRQLWQRQFSWNKWSTNAKGSTQQLLVPRSGLVTSTYFRFPYGYGFTDMETSARTIDPNDSTADPKKSGRSGLTIKVNIELLIEVQAFDVDHMLFPDLTWYTELIAAIEQILRGEVGRLTYEELVEERHHANHGGITRTIMDSLCGGKIQHNGVNYDMVPLIETDFEGIDNETANALIALIPSVQQIGVIVRKIDLRNIAVSGTPEEVEKILSTINAPAVAQKQAEAKLITARAEGASIREVGAAKAEVIKHTGAAEASSILARTSAYGTGEIGRVVAQGDGNARALEKVPWLTHLVTGERGVGVILGDSNRQGAPNSNEPQDATEPAPAPTQPAATRQQYRSAKTKSWTDDRRRRKGGKQ